MNVSTVVLVVAGLATLGLGLPYAFKLGYERGISDAAVLEDLAKESWRDEVPTDIKVPSVPAKESSVLHEVSLEPKSNAVGATEEELLAENREPEWSELPLNQRIVLFDTFEQGLEILAHYEEHLPQTPREKAQYARFMTRFGEKGGEDAFVAAFGDGSEFGLRAIGYVAAGWARSEPDIAWASLIQASNNGAIRQVNLRSALNEIGKSDLSLAIGYLEDVHGVRQVSEFGYLISRQNSPESLALALDATLAAENLGSRDRMAEVLFDKWADLDFESSLEAVSTIADQDLASSSMQGLMKSWAEEDGAAALNFVLENEGDPTVEGTLMTVAKTWLRNSTTFDSEPIFDALHGLPDRDQLVYDLAGDMVAANPERTLELAGQIEDDRLRNTTYAKAMTYWSRNDIDAAEDYALLTEAEVEKASMLRALTRGRLKLGGGLNGISDAVGQMESADNRRSVLIGLELSRRKIGTRVTDEQNAEIDAVMQRHTNDMSAVSFLPDGRVMIRRSKPKPEEGSGG